MTKSISILLLSFLILFSSCGENEIEVSNRIPNISLFHTTVQSLDLTGIEIIDGDVYLFNSDAVDLSFLANIKQINGDIRISNNKNLTSLNGIENLQTLESVILSSNNKLVDISALDNIVITKNFSLIQNGLSNAKPLTALSNHVEYVLIDEELESLDVLANLKSVGALRINRCLTTNLSDLAKLKIVENSLILEDNPHLEDFCEMKNLFTENSSATFEARYNKFNPSIEEIIEDCE